MTDSPTAKAPWIERLVQLPTVLFLICFFTFFAVVTSRKPRVLVLHSYTTNFAWVRDINVGLDWELESKPYTIRYHYMDTKRNPSTEFKEKAGQAARRIIREWEPDVVIAVDDNAQNFAVKFFNDDPNIKIVFTGVNAPPSKYGYDTANNATGMLERIPFDALREAFLQILPEDRRRIIHYSDNSPTSKAIHEELGAYSWDPIDVVEHTMVDTFEEWKEFILAADQKADFLLITHYHTMVRSSTDDTRVRPGDVMKWTAENSPIPDIGCWGFYVEDGGTLAIGLSPQEMGYEAARMAISIIDDKVDPKSIPIGQSKLYVVYLSKSRTERFDMELPLVYRAFAAGTNNEYP